MIELGGIVLDSWAALVTLGFILGLESCRWRGIQQGLDVRDIVDGGVFIVGSGFVGGHIVHVLAYNPHQLEEQGIWALLKIWAGFSSYGGFLGAVAAAVLFLNLPRFFGDQAKVFSAKGATGAWSSFVQWAGRPKDFWKHGDAYIFGFPLGWTFGRLGCFSAHDHVGARSDFFLAVDFPAATYGGPRHDLGLYEALWTAVIAATFYAFRNRPVQPGFFCGALVRHVRPRPPRARLPAQLGSQRRRCALGRAHPRAVGQPDDGRRGPRAGAQAVAPCGAAPDHIPCLNH